MISDTQFFIFLVLFITLFCSCVFIKMVVENVDYRQRGVWQRRGLLLAALFWPLVIAWMAIDFVLQKIYKLLLTFIKIFEFATKKNLFPYDDAKKTG